MKSIPFSARSLPDARSTTWIPLRFWIQGLKGSNPAVDSEFYSGEYLLQYHRNSCFLEVTL